MIVMTKEKKAIASMLRKLADDMADIAERMDRFKEIEEWSIHSIEMREASEIANDLADSIESEINNHSTDYK